jgi:acetolactate synthase-1/2/3 large subunit
MSGASFGQQLHRRRANGPLITIRTGFTYALTGLAEALHDSAAVLHIVGDPAAKAARKFAFQALDQSGIAGSLVKRVFSIGQADEIPRLVAEAYDLALSGEPGPVLLQWSKEALADLPASFDGKSLDCGVFPSSSWREAHSLGGCRTSCPSCGQYCWSRRTGATTRGVDRFMFTTASGRVLPEDHAWL